MTTTLETILFTSVGSIVSILVTFHISRWRFHRAERQRYKAIELKADTNYTDLKVTLIKIVTALCNCNGLGERFKLEMEKLDEGEKIISG